MRSACMTTVTSPIPLRVHPPVLLPHVRAPKHQVVVMSHPLEQDLCRRSATHPRCPPRSAMATLEAMSVRSLQRPTLQPLDLRSLLDLAGVVTQTVDLGAPTRHKHQSGVRNGHDRYSFCLPFEELSGWAVTTGKTAFKRAYVKEINAMVGMSFSLFSRRLTSERACTGRHGGDI